MNVRNPSPQAVLAATVSLTAAQLAALDVTPITLVPAPGANRIITVLGVALAYKFVTIAYQGAGGGALSFKYAGAAADKVAADVSGLVTGAASGFFYEAGLLLGNVAILPGDDNQAVLLTTSNTLNAGPIVTATKGAGGAGYAINDTGTINDGSDDATYKVLTVDGGGAVLTFQVTGAGTDYTVENGVATATGGAQPGVGVGFTVNITAVQTGDGTLKVTTFYSILPVS